MKEFVDKLIERLEEKKAKRIRWLGMPDIQCEGYTEAISIVNQVAEEYEREVDQTDYANIELYAFWKKHQWIPCSERLPENISTVLVQVKEIEKPTLGWYGNMQGWRLTENDFSNLKEFTVIAWMPLPIPYQPKGE